MFYFKAVPKQFFRTTIRLRVWSITKFLRHAQILPLTFDLGQLDLLAEFETGNSGNSDVLTNFGDSLG